MDAHGSRSKSTRCSGPILIKTDTLFLALPVSWKETQIQYAGRLHRLHPEKAEVRIYDYVDRDVPMLARMFEKRLRGYRAIGYSTEIASAP